MYNYSLIYSYINYFRFLSDFETDSELTLVYNTLTEIFKQITLWMTPVSDMPSIIFSGGSLNNDSAVSVFFHVYFDIRWSLVEMAFMASNLRKYSESARKNREKISEILSQLQESLCSDLMYLGLRRFPDVSMTLCFTKIDLFFTNFITFYSRFLLVIGLELLHSIAHVLEKSGICCW